MWLFWIGLLESPKPSTRAPNGAYTFGVASLNASFCTAGVKLPVVWTQS